MRFLVDMPLSPTLVQWLQRQGHAVDLGMGRSSDSEIMDRALTEGRTVIAADLDYPRLLAAAGATGPSLLLFRGGDWGEAESILVVDRDRVRRRRLPIV